MRELGGLALVGLLATGCGGGGGSSGTPPQQQVQVDAPNGARRLQVTVDVAADETARRNGLAGWASLPDGHGLLIVMPVEGETCIHNTGVVFAIDAVFADRNGSVVAVESDIPAGDPTLRCVESVQRILEVNAGDAATAQVGDRLVGP